MTFVRNARVMLVGFALAQALPLLASPLLARLYSPEAFGLQTLFVGVTSVLLVVATLRLDLATVIAADRREATRIFSLGVLQIIAIGLMTAIAAAALAPMVTAALGHPGKPGWVWAVAPMVIALATTQLASGMLTWLKRFGPVSRAQVANQFAYLGIAIGLGMVGSPLTGLVVAKLVGQIVAAASIAWLLRGFFRRVRVPPRNAWGALWARCKPFLQFNTPYSLVGVVGRDVPVFAFAAASATAAAGFYGLARTLLWAPAMLVAASLSQVFYREAAEHRGTARLERFTFAILALTARAAAPLFAFVATWGDPLFAFLFGAEWTMAGRYATLLAIPGWLAIQTAWPERLFESVGRQGVSFTIQITFDLLSAALVFGSVLAGRPAFETVAVFAAVNALFHLAFLTGMVRAAGFRQAMLARTMGGAALVFALAASGCHALRLATAGSLFGMVAAGALAAGAALALGWRFYRPVLALERE